MKKIAITLALIVLAPVAKRQWMRFWDEVGVVADERRFRQRYR